MAKEKEEYEFQMPTFNEEEFVNEQKKKAKSSFISFAFGILMGIICSFIWRILDDPSLKWPLTFLLGACSIGFLLKLYGVFKIDISTFEKKDWLGTGAFYFFTFLAIFIISINPPFYDGAPPKIETIALPGLQELGGNMTIVAKITDNTQIANQKIDIIDPEGNRINHSLIKENNIIYFYEFSNDINAEGTFLYTIWAEDSNDFEVTKNGEFNYGQNFVYIDQYQNNKRISTSDEIKIRIKYPIEDKEKIRVYYTINKGNEINATFSGIDTDAGELIYATSTRYKGWTTGTVTMEIFVDVVYYFILPKDVNQSENTSRSPITDNQNYSFYVESIGNEPSPAIELPGPRTLERVPGFEVISATAAVLLIIILKKRKNLEKFM